MVTLDQLVERVRVDARNELGLFTLPPSIGRRVVEAFVKATIAGLGLYVSETTGEVYDPAPKPVINYPNQQNVHYRGQRGRKAGRR